MPRYDRRRLARNGPCRTIGWEDPIAPLTPDQIRRNITIIDWAKQLSPQRTALWYERHPEQRPKGHTD